MGKGEDYSLTCPNPKCGRKVPITDASQRGKRITCPFCSERVTIPNHFASTAAVPSSPGDSMGVDTQFGDFHILEKLGEGGMGTVYKARNTKLDRVVALKLIASGLRRRSPRLVQRFLREARSAARLEHPNIVRVYSVGEVDQRHYIEMQYVQGKTIAEELQEGKRLDVEESLRIVTDAAQALRAAHESGIVHRDVKPQNIMLTDAGEVMVTDFGLAKAIESADITASGQVLGTPTYMSPEQCEGKAVDERSDIYSLGATLFRMITGEPPFRGETPLVVMRKHTDTPAPDPSKLKPDIPPAVAAIVTRMLRKRPEERYQSCRELVEAIGRVQKPSEAAGRPASRKRLVLAAIPIVAVILALVSAVLIYTRRHSTVETETSIRSFPPAEAVRSIQEHIAERRRGFAQRTISVSKSGRADYSTLNEAILAAGKGDIVEVCDAATYEEAVVVTVPHIYVRAREGCRPCIDAARKSPRCFEITDTADGAVIEGFKCIGATCEGILVKPGAKDVLLFQNTCSRSRWGIKVSGDGMLLAANVVHDNRSYGIQMLEAAGHVAYNASFRNSSGADLRRSDDVVFEDNILHSNRSSGLLCRESRNVQICGNIFWGCMENGLELEDSHTIQIKKNAVVRCGRAGIKIDEKSTDIMSDLNNIFNCRATGIFAGRSCPTLSDWVQASSLDANSRAADPGFANPPSEF